MSDAIVDQRIVQMQFDNKGFERDVNSTLNILDKLKQSLAFSNVKSGFDNIQSGISRLNFSPIDDGLYGLHEKFGMLEMIGLRAMQKIADAAISTGQKLASALTITPIKSGLQEYETQIGAIQTIMANTEEAFEGVSEQEHLNKVNEALDDLNHYADKTIYNFTEMTNNIGRFTAAGVDLKTSQESIKGIANLAAVSGSTSQQASTAMYQLSQAIASGTVRLQDWNSVVNASMGGSVFQNALKEASKAMVVANEKVQALAASGKDANQISEETGISLKKVENLMKNGYAVSADQAIEKTGNFRESLREGWMTTDVLTDALRNFTYDLSEMSEEEKELACSTLEANGYTQEQIDHIFKMSESAVDAATKVKTFSQLIDTTKEALQSGWTQTWEYIIGDFGEAKDLWSGISDYLNGVIGRSSDARNALFKAWHDDENGRKAVLDGLKTSFNNIAKVTTEVKNSFNSVFSTLPLPTLIQISKAFKEWSERMTPTEKQLEHIHEVANNLATPILLLKDALSALSSNKDFSTLTKEVTSLASKVITFGSSVFAFVMRFLSASGIVQKTVSGVTKAASSLINVLSSIYEHGKDVVLAFFGINESFFNTVNAFKKGHEFGKTLDGVKTKVENLKNSLQDFFTHVNNLIIKITGVDLTKVFSWDNIISKVKTFGETIRSIPQTVTDFKNKVTTNFEGIIATINKFTGLNLHIPSWKEIEDAVDFIKTNLASYGTAFETAKTSVTGYFNGILTKLSPLTDAFNNAKIAVGNFFTSLKDGSKKKDSDGISVLDSIMNALKVAWGFILDVGGKIKTALGQLWDTLLKIASTVNFGDVVKGILGGSTIMWMNKTTGFFDNLLGKLDDMKKTASGGGIMDFINGITDKLKGAAETFKSVFEPLGDTLATFQDKLKADMLKNISIAIAILVGSLVVISLVDTDKLGTAIIAIGVLMGELLGTLEGFNKLGGGLNPRSFSQLTTSLIKMSVSILIMASAMKSLSELEPDQIKTGLVAIGAMLVMLTIFAKQFSTFDAGGLATVASSTISLAIGLRLMVGAVAGLGELPVKQLEKGLIGVAALLASLAIFTKLSSLDGVGAFSGVGIILIATGIRILMGAVEQFSKFSWEEIVKGLAGISGILLSLGLFTRIGDLDKIGPLKGVGLILFAKAVDMLASTMMPLMRVKWSTLGKGLVGIGGLMLELAVATRMMPKNLLGVGLGMVVAVAAIKMMTGALMSIGTGMDWEQIAKGLVAIGGAMLILAAGANAMRGAITGAAAMVVMSMALGMLVPVLMILGNMEWESIAKGLVAIAGVFVILGVAGYALGPVVGVIFALAGALAVIGLSTVLAGAGLLAVGAGLSSIIAATMLLTKSADMLVGFFDSLLTGVITLGPRMTEALFTAINSLLTALLSSIPKFSMLVLAGGTAVLTTLNALIPRLIATGINLLLALLTGISNNIGKVIFLAASIMIQFLEGLAITAPLVVQAGIDFIVSMINGMAEALINNADTIITALNNVMWSILYTLLALIQNAVEQIPGIGGMISDKIEGIKEDIKSKVNFEEGKKVTGDAVSGAKAGIEDLIPEVGGAADGVTNTINDSLKKVDTSSISASVQEGVVGGLTGAQGEAEGAAGLLGAGVTNTLAGYDTSSGGTAMVDKIFGELGGAESTGKMTEVGQLLANSGMTGFDSVDPTASGENFVNTVSGSISTNKGKVQGAGKEAGEAGSAGVDSTWQNFYNSGGYIMDGAANGIRDNTYKVEDAARAAGNAAHGAYNTASGVDSPSWKFAESGFFQMLGGANGITDNIGLVTSAAKLAGDETVNAFANSIAQMEDEGGYFDSPTIRPVLDLGEIQNGAQTIDSMLSGDMAKQVSVTAAGKVDVGSAVGELSSITNSGNSKLVELLIQQAEQNEKLIHLLENQRIYLDGNTLVGKTIGRIDNALGQRAILAGGRRG